MKRVPLRRALVLFVIVAAGCGYTFGGAPQLVFPANGAALGCAVAPNNYVFTWNGVPNAVNYNGEVRVQPSDAVVGVFNVLAPTVTATLPPAMHTCGVPATYRWRVAATFGVNPTPAYSDWWTFSLP